MIDPIVGPFDYKLDPPFPQHSYTCGWCEGSGVMAMDLSNTCDCECHTGKRSVMAMMEHGHLAQTFGLDMLDAIEKGQGYCRGCRESHPCPACDGRGEA